MSERVEPALTPEQWAAKSNGEFQIVTAPRIGRDGELYIWRGARVPAGGDGEGTDVYDPHGAAALLLYGQPFGFTWEDVDALRGEAAGLRNNGWHGWQSLEDLADRIAALLPPRKVVPETEVS